MEDSGFLDALLPEESDGAGLSLAEAFPLLLLAGQYAVPVPFAQTMLARAWLHAAGVKAPAGSITLAGFGVRKNADRKSLGEGTSVSVSVDLGGRRIIAKKTNNNRP